MQKNEIFEQILSDFLEKHTEVLDKKVLQDFCEYAKTWFFDNGVIGVAQTANGFALRFKDGSERILFSPDYVTVADGPSIAISGNSGGSVRITAPIVDTSVQITG